MKTKFKDFLLYSLACVGAVSLFLSAYQPQQTTSTVPESHIWEMAGFDNDFFMWNKKTGELRKVNGNAYFSEKDGQSFMYGTMIELPSSMRNKAK